MLRMAGVRCRSESKRFTDPDSASRDSAPLQDTQDPELDSVLKGAYANKNDSPDPFSVSRTGRDNLEKTQKKALEAQVKTMTGEAEKLEKAGQLVEARIKYAESQALIEVKDVTDALKRVDEEIRKRVKDALNESRKLYEARKFKEAAAVLDEGMKLQAFQPVLSYDLALCYYQLGDRSKALEYLMKAKTGTVDPKQKQKTFAASDVLYHRRERALSERQRQGSHRPRQQPRRQHRPGRILGR